MQQPGKFKHNVYPEYSHRISVKLGPNSFCKTRTILAEVFLLSAPSTPLPPMTSPCLSALPLNLALCITCWSSNQMEQIQLWYCMQSISVSAKVCSKLEQPIPSHCITSRQSLFFGGAATCGALSPLDGTQKQTVQFTNTHSGIPSWRALLLLKEMCYLSVH